MLELLGLGIFAVLVWVLGRTLLGAIFYLVIYGLVARAAYMLLGNELNLNGPLTFWVSRVAFIALTIWIGGRLRVWLGRFPVFVLLVVLLFIYFMAQVALHPPQIYYYRPGILI